MRTSVKDEFRAGRVPPLPPGPTTARPGSREKVAVMAERVAGGYRVHHPEDLRFVLARIDYCSRGGRRDEGRGLPRVVASPGRFKVQRSDESYTKD